MEEPSIDADMEQVNGESTSAGQQLSWRYLMGGGILLVVLGLIAISTPFVTGITLSVVLGGLLVVGALAHVVHAFSGQEGKGSIWQIALAVVYTFAGISLIVNPIIGLTSLTLLVIGYFVVDGIVEIASGLRMRSEPRWALVVASGTISLVLAGLLWIGFPSTALWAIGLLFGVNILTTGLSLVAIAMVSRKYQSSTTGQPPETRPRSV